WWLVLHAAWRFILFHIRPRARRVYRSRYTGTGGRIGMAHRVGAISCALRYGRSVHWPSITRLPAACWIACAHPSLISDEASVGHHAGAADHELALAGRCLQIVVRAERRRR